MVFHDFTYFFTEKLIFKLAHPYSKYEKFMNIEKVNVNANNT